MRQVFITSNLAMKPIGTGTIGKDFFQVFRDKDGELFIKKIIKQP